jgi:CspA family cold shock protein
MAQHRGTIKWFNNAKGYGFIGREDAPDLFVHYSSVQQEGYKSLREGDEIEFDVVQGSDGPRANQVVIVKQA